MRVGAVILAAGSSSRMGRPKQTLQFRGESLLRRAALAALDAGCDPVVVVTGAYAELSRGELGGLDAREVLNPRWETGMASSIQAGVEDLIRADPDAAVFLLCDQPHVTADVISGLVAAYRETGRPIVASTYGGGFGVPALFGRKLFAELTRLEGMSGAKEVIWQHASEAHFIPFEGGEVDVDTPDDFSRLLAERRSSMRIGILGSGLMGGKLGTIFARAGHEVVFSYARGEEKLKKLARDAGGNARAGTPGEAARNADALLLAVHWSRIEDVLSQAGDLSGKVVLTCSLPMNAEDTELVIAGTKSGAEELARMIPKARVVSAFNTVPSEVLFGVYEARTEEGRPSLVYCGDDESGKEVAADLIRDVGFAPVDAGPLRIARYTEPFALLVAQLAYEGEEGPELAYRFEWFEK